MQEFDSGQIRTRTRLMKILQTQLTKERKKISREMVNFILYTVECIILFLNQYVGNLNLEIIYTLFQSLIRPPLLIYTLCLARGLL